jgi:outer membrane protein assembly factor BamB
MSPATQRNALPVGPRCLVPPRRVLITLASLATAAAMVRAGLLEHVVGAIVDHAVRNIITLILAFSGLVSLVLWFLRESGYSARLKRAVGWGLVAAVALACALVRIERVSGDLVPQFAFRWAASRDRLLPRAGQATADGEQRGAAADWTPRPEQDFPRFLGPHGSAGIDSVAIALPGAETGRGDGGNFAPVVWRQPIGAGWGGFAICGDHAVTLEQRGDEELVTCRSVVTGEIEWVVPVTARHQTVLGGVGPRSTPTIRDGVVYSTGGTGWLHAIDGPSGRAVWRKNVLDDLGIDAAAHDAALPWGRAGSPLVTDSLVVVPGGGPRAGVEAGAGGFVSLVAYDRATGARVWTGGTEQISYATPALVSLAGEDLILVVNEAHVAAYDPVTGEERWSFDWPGHSNSDASCSQAHVVAGDRIFVSKGYGIGAAVFERTSAAGPRPLWSTVWSKPALLKTKYANVAIHDGHAYGLSDGILECVRVADGKRMWKGGRYGQGQVLRVSDTLLVQCESGEVVLVACTPDAHRVVARTAALSGQTWNNPAVSGDRLLVRNAEEAACLRLPLVSGPGNRP